MPNNQLLLNKLLAALAYAYRPQRAAKRSTNISAISRALDISRPTAQSLMDGKSKWRWWPAVILEAIDERMLELPVEERRWVRTLLKDLPDEYFHKVARSDEAELYLREQLSTGPALMTEIMRPHNRLTISEARIKRAAKKIGVIKERSGRREEHQVTWRLPTLDDWYAEHESELEQRLTLSDDRQPHVVTVTKRRPRR